MNASALILSIAALTAAPQDALYDFYAPWCGPCQRMMPVVDRLKAEGHPIIKINIQERPDLAQRFGVGPIPAFMLFVGGSSRELAVGMQDESKLRQMLAQIPSQEMAAPERAPDSPAPKRSGRRIPVRLTDDGDPPKSKWDFHLPIPSFSGRKPEMVQIDDPTVSNTRGRGPVSSAPREPARNDLALAQEPAEVEGTCEPGDAKMRAASVRIRVKDAGGILLGSGVMIRSVTGLTYVLTCGHVLREATNESRIEVDVFDGKRSRSFLGKIVKFDLAADVGLIVIETPSAVTCCPVASAENAVRAGEAVVSIGCSNGETPSLERQSITVLNRYQGPDTIECTGVPAQGRSGGGLFMANGSVVGVCTNADSRERRGVYAGLKPILELLQSAGLDEPAPTAKPRQRALAQAAEGAPAEESGPTKLELQLAQMDRARGQDSPDSARAATTPSASLGDGRNSTGVPKSIVSRSGEPHEPAGDLSAKSLDGVEVTCIIRDLNHPQAGSRVVIINRASRKFMTYLTGEKDQLVQTMASSAAGSQPREMVSNESAIALETTAAANDPPAQTTATWKPSAQPRTARKPAANESAWTVTQTTSRSQPAAASQDGFQFPATTLQAR